MDSYTLLPLWCFSNHKYVTTTREFFYHLSTYTYDGEGEVAWLEFLHDFLSMLHEEDGCSDKQGNLLLAYHFTNLHIDGCATYWMKTCTHLRTFVISLKTLSIIFIQTILTKKCYNNGRLHMNRLWIFCSASVICNFKLWRARWNFSIFGTDSSIVLRNILVPRRSLKSSLAKYSSAMELCNHRWMRSLSQVTVL